MKVEFDKKLFKYGVYITLTAIVIYVSFLLLFNIGTIFKTTFAILAQLINLIKPLLIAIVIAYLLFPITNGIEKFLDKNKFHKFKNESTKRVLAILGAYLLIVGIIMLLIWGIYFMIGGQLSNNTTLTNIIDEITEYLRNSSLSATSIKTAIEGLNIPLLDNLEPHIINAINSLQTYIASNLGNMTSSIMSIGSSIASFFIAFIISIYLLKDYEYFLSLWNKIYYLIFGNSILGGKITHIFKVIHDVFGKYIRGQLLEACFVGILSSIALAIAGIDYAIVIGLIAGISNMIPYVGPIVGTVLAGIMGLASGKPIKVLYAIIAMLIVQQVDNNLLAPKIVGNSVGLHAVFTMMAILIGGNIGGLFGMLLAVPIAASLKVLFNDWYDKYTKTERKNKKNIIS